MIIPLDLTQLSCPSFTLAAGLPSGFTTDRVSCWGGALWRACNLTSFSPCLTGPVDYPFASFHKGPGFKSRGGYLSETGILLLALSFYKRMFTAQVELGRKCFIQFLQKQKFNENLENFREFFENFSQKLRNFRSQIFVKISFVSFSRKYKTHFCENLIPFCKEKHVKDFCACF